MYVLIIFVVGLVIFLYFRYVAFKNRYKDLDKLPGPPVKIFTGNALEFGSNVHDLFMNSQRIVKTYGRLVRIWLGPYRMYLFVTDPEKVQFFLSSEVLIKKSDSYDLYKPWLGDGLINSTGELWRKHRKILTPAFHFKILEQFSDIFHSNVKILVENLAKEAGKTIDVFPIVTLYAMDSLCETSMGANHRYQRHSKTGYMEALHGFLVIFMNRFFSILKRYELFFWFTADYRKMKHYVEVMQKVTKEVIRKRKVDLQNGSREADDSDKGDVGIKKKRVFLDTLLEYPGLSDEEIRWEVDTFLFAGHDTISTAMSFSLYVIAKYPKVQQRILEEIHDVVGCDVEREITLPELKEMGYLDRVIKEVLRLYPPAPLFEREMTEDVILDGMKIPKGTTVSFHPYSQHRDPELFLDPEKFDPDRFLPENISKRHPFAYIPFSAGPRNCIGQKYAMMNLKTTVANVIRNFILRPADYPHIPKLGLEAVLKSLNGLPIKISLREK